MESLKFKNLESFYEHTNKHVENVCEIFDFLIDSISKNQNFMNDFGIKSLDELEKFRNIGKEVIKFHDTTKLTTNSDFLKKHSLDKPFIENLYEHTGKSMPTELIYKLNSIDKKEVDNLLKKSKFSEKQIKLFTWLEKTSDAIERGQNPISKIEFGREMTRCSEYNPTKKERTKAEMDIIFTGEEYYDSNIKPRQEKLLKKLTEKYNSLKYD